MAVIEGSLRTLFERAFLLILLCAASGGCSEAYCQSGPKYGTTCYSVNQLESRDPRERTDAMVQRATQPSPGCALLTAKGITTVPQPRAGAASAPLPPSYLMSGACTSSSQLVRGGPVSILRPSQ